MRQTLSNSWNFLTSKLHQPLPLNRRDSQKLLSLLNESFNRNLDRQYPPGLAGSERSADEHFQSVLKSPFFGANRARHISISDRKKETKQDAAQVRDLMFAVKEPVEYFRQQVVTGAASIASAKLVLDSQMKKALASASIDAKDSMRSAGIGSVMANWLWSSGQYERLEFIRDRDFVARLMPFLVAEGQYKPVWEWLQRSQFAAAGNNDGRTTFQQDVGYMTKRLVQSEVSYGQGLQSAIQMFLTNLRSIRPPTPAASLYQSTRVNHPAGVYLTWKLASQRTSSGVDGTVVDSFDHSVELWVSRHLIAPYRALIQLLHPQKPRNSLAAQLVSTTESSVIYLTGKERMAFVRVVLKAVEVLLARDSLKEAAQVMKVLQLKFASELGPDEKPAEGRQNDEEAVLRSLNLNLAT
ncbi:MAG: hypothetical protein L6R39_002163 [Caloplaca ligustica]|nr:MAG: hypothetical protein L6R39_002163 [Caloplaca ligustica]